MLIDSNGENGAVPLAEEPPAPKPKRKRPAKPKKAKKAKTKKKPRHKAKPGLKKGLYKVVHPALPKKYRNGDDELDFRAIIKAIKMTPEGVYKWFRTDRLAAKGAIKLIKISGGKLKGVDLIPFVLR